MQLLITTQAVDLDDPILGFFHRWIEELSQRFESISVICLKEGRHELPGNVRVYSLGKPHSAEASRGAGSRTFLRIKYLSRFFKYIFALRAEYDAVFVHMNSEYACLGGPFWRLWGKRLVLWRNHVLNGSSTWVGAHLASTVCYTSPRAYTARFKNSMQMPIGIDTEKFSGDAAGREAGSILFIGRLDEIKNPALFIEALALVHAKRVSFHAQIVGDPTHPESSYQSQLKARIQELGLASMIEMRPGVSNDEAVNLFRSCALYVNLTPSGSFDKTIGEAAACRALEVVANDVMRSILPESLIVDVHSADSVAHAIETALALPDLERETITQKAREYVVQQHSLLLLIERLTQILSS